MNFIHLHNDIRFETLSKIEAPTGETKDLNKILKQKAFDKAAFKRDRKRSEVRG